MPKTTFPNKAYLVISILLLLGIANMPYGYYSVLRIVICGFSSIIAYQIFELLDQEKSKWPWLYIAIAVLFNPFIPIYLGKIIWTFVDIVLGIAFFIIYRKVKLLEKS
jgi:hypothetical protein